MNHRQGTASLRIAVLAGGDSAEREISLRSGTSVLAALRQLGHAVTLIDSAEMPCECVDWASYDVAFLALHGGAGEDGRLQQQLETLGVAYTGSGPQASQLAMSKSRSKQVFAAAGVPTKPYVTFDPRDSHAAIREAVATLGWPMIFKPDSQGSSLGVSVVSCAADIPAAATICAQYESLALAEPLIVGREFTVALLGRRALPVVEILASSVLFSYEAKYASPDTQFRFDFVLDADALQKLEQAAIAAAASLQTRGLVRVDVMLDQENQPWVIEVNTIPGMTDRSLAPLAAARAGISLFELCQWSIQQALEIGDRWPQT